MWSNMLLLFWLSLVPFVTGWMGENNFEKTTVAIYGVLLIVCGLSFTLLNSMICKTYKEQTNLTRAIARSNVKGIWSIVLYSAAILSALFIHPAISAVLYAIVSVIWIIPSKEIEKALADE